MKHVKIFLAAAIIVAASLTSQACKRGKEDPFLSLISRDARIAAVWRLVAINGSSKATSVSGSTTTVSTSTQKYENGTQTVTQTSGSTTNTYTSKFNFQMTMEKAGDFTCKTDNFNTSGTLTSSSEGDGSWQWLADGKNKSNVNIVEGSGSFMSGISEVLGLKNKTLILRRHNRSKSASGTTSYESVSETTYTFEAE